ncbi:MAG: hypothetical protein NTW79_01325 [Candidatus Berkelbacteria bacterium]|nr:hypothetical protein [Candidatus Berkelbacteria bacterium]
MSVEGESFDPEFPSDADLGRDSGSESGRPPVETPERRVFRRDGSTPSPKPEIALPPTRIKRTGFDMLRPPVEPMSAGRPIDGKSPVEKPAIIHRPKSGLEKPFGRKL